MSVYKTLRDVNFGGQIISAGVEVDLSQYDEAFVQRLIEKKSIVEVSSEAAAAPVAAPEPTEPPVETPVEGVPGQPTPEQIQKDFQDAGVENSPNVPQPN